jgi:hypothetical protein
MRIKIKKGNHYPFPGFAIGLPKWVSKNKLTTADADFYFTESCLYDLKDEDQHDVNKLFGFSIGYHHKTSFRFGWRPILETRQIEIVAYEYHDNLRQATIPIGKIEINKWYRFVMGFFPLIQKTVYSINGTNLGATNSVNIKKKYGLGYTLGFYFGGNETAPQDIIVFKK